MMLVNTTYSQHKLIGEKHPSTPTPPHAHPPTHAHLVSLSGLKEASKRGCLCVSELPPLKIDTAPFGLCYNPDGNNTRKESVRRLIITTHTVNGTVSTRTHTRRGVGVCKHAFMTDPAVRLKDGVRTKRSAAYRSSLSLTMRHTKLFSSQSTGVQAVSVFVCNRHMAAADL